MLLLRDFSIPINFSIGQEDLFRTGIGLLAVSVHALKYK